MSKISKHIAKWIVPALLAAGAFGLIQHNSSKKEAGEIENITYSNGIKKVTDNRIGIPGTLFTPKKKSDVLVIIEGGISGDQRDYQKYFAKPLAEEYNVYTTELKNRGIAFSSTFPDDFANKERIVRKIVSPKSEVYIGHSVGFNVVASAINKHNLRPDGVYGVSPFPSVGETRTESSDPSNKSLLQKVCDNLDELVPVGPLGRHFERIKGDIPVRVAIPENDEFVNSEVSFNPINIKNGILPLSYKKRLPVLSRYVEYFRKNGITDIQIFPGRNHCFNYEQFDFRPFNKDNSKSLITDVRNFIRKVISSGN